MLAGLFRAYSGAGGPTEGRVCYVFVTGVWEVELLAAGDLVGYIGPVRVMRWMCIVLSTSLTLLLLL